MGAADRAALRGLLGDYDRAAAEVTRLSRPDDLGSGERTARLSSLGAWEMQQARIVERIAALAGGAPGAPYAPDFDRLRALLGAPSGASEG